MTTIATPVEPDDEPLWDSEPNPEMVRWQPTHSADAVAVKPVTLSTTGALGLIAVGSAVVGALAVGAVAIGALAIGSLAVGRARVRRLQIDELLVGKITFKE